MSRVGAPSWTETALLGRGRMGLVMSSPTAAPGRPGSAQRRPGKFRLVRSRLGRSAAGIQFLDVWGWRWRSGEATRSGGPRPRSRAPKPPAAVSSEAMVSACNMTRRVPSRGVTSEIEGGQPNLQVELGRRHGFPCPGGSGRRRRRRCRWPDAVMRETSTARSSRSEGTGLRRCEPVPDQVQQVIAHDDVLCRLLTCVLGMGLLFDSGWRRPGEGVPATAASVPSYRFSYHWPTDCVAQRH